MTEGNKSGYDSLAYQEEADRKIKEMEEKRNSDSTEDKQSETEKSEEELAFTNGQMVNAEIEGKTEEGWTVTENGYNPKTGTVEVKKTDPNGVKTIYYRLPVDKVHIIENKDEEKDDQSEFTAGDTVKIRENGREDDGWTVADYNKENGRVKVTKTDPHGIKEVTQWISKNLVSKSATKEPAADQTQNEEVDGSITVDTVDGAKEETGVDFTSPAEAIRRSNDAVEKAKAEEAVKKQIDSNNKEIEDLNKSLQEAIDSGNQNQANLFKNRIDQLNSENSELQTETDGTTEPEKDEPGTEKTEETPGDKINNLLEKDIEQVNNTEKKFSERSLQWLQRNSKLRIATGIAISGIAAVTGMNTAIWAARGIMGAIGGAVGFSGLKAGRREQASLQKHNTEFGKYIIQDGPDAGQLDVETISQKVQAGEINIQDVKDLYKEFTEIASAQGRKIDTELQKKEKETAGQLQGRFKDNKTFQWFNKLDWKLKALAGIGVAVGAGAVGASVAGGLVGASVARVLFSGAAQLGMGALQKSPETNFVYYAHSDKIEALSKVIEQNGGLSQEDIDNFTQYREDVRKGRIKDAAIGGAVMGTLIGGVSAYFGHHSIEHGGANNHTTTIPLRNGAAEDGTPTVNHTDATVPFVNHSEVTSDHVIHPVVTGNESQVQITEVTPAHALHAEVPGNEPIVKITEVTPGTGDHVNLLKHDMSMASGAEAAAAHAPHVGGLKGPEIMSGPGLHLKPEYLEKASNTGLNADKHLAEVELRGHLDRMGEHFKNHAEFEAARDQLVKEWHTTHPGMFAADGSIRPEHLHDITSTLQSTDAKSILDASGAALVENGAIESHLGHVPTEHGGESVEHAGRVMTPHETENIANEHLSKVTGAKVPPTWQVGHNFDAYSHGKPLNEAGVIDTLQNKQISKDSLNYIRTLFQVKAIKPEDIHVSPDGKYLMFNAPDSAAHDVVWTTEIRDKSIFSRLFPGRAEDIKDIFPQSHAATEAVTTAGPNQVGQSNVAPEASSGGVPDQSSLVHEPSTGGVPGQPLSTGGNNELHFGHQPGVTEDQGIHPRPMSDVKIEQGGPSFSQTVTKPEAPADIPASPDNN